MIPDDPALQTFGMIWRFSDAAKYTQLSECEFSRFMPTSEIESLGLWQELVCDDSSPTHRRIAQLCAHGVAQWPRFPRFRSESEEAESNVVRNLVRDVTADDASEVVFFWRAEIAVRTDWRLFLDHWDDFCYPSDDNNIAVLPKCGKAVAFIEERWYVFDKQVSLPVFTIGPR